MTNEQVIDLLADVAGTPIEEKIKAFVDFRRRYLTSDNVDAIYGLQTMDAMKDEIVQMYRRWKETASD